MAISQGDELRKMWIYPTNRKSSSVSPCSPTKLSCAMPHMVERLFVIEWGAQFHELNAFYVVLEMCPNNDQLVFPIDLILGNFDSLCDMSSMSRCQWESAILFSFSSHITTK